MGLRIEKRAGPIGLRIAILCVAFIVFLYNFVRICPSKKGAVGSVFLFFSRLWKSHIGVKNVKKKREARRSPFATSARLNKRLTDKRDVGNRANWPPYSLR